MRISSYWYSLNLRGSKHNCWCNLVEDLPLIAPVITNLELYWFKSFLLRNFYYTLIINDIFIIKTHSDKELIYIVKREFLGERFCSFWRTSRHLLTFFYFSFRWMLRVSLSSKNNWDGVNWASVLLSLIIEWICLPSFLDCITSRTRFDISGLNAIFYL